jgi:hypothetical protein
MLVLLWLALATLAAIATINAWLIIRMLAASQRVVTVNARRVRHAPFAVPLSGPRVVAVAHGWKPIRRRNR